MNKLLLTSLLILFCCTLSAQAEARKTPIYIGYFGHSLIHPGIKIGTQFDLKVRPVATEETDRFQRVFVSPQLGWYTYLNVHAGLLINAEIGYQWKNKIKDWHMGFSLGFGFLNQSHITSVSVNLGDGSKENTIDNRGWFLPTLNYEIGNSFSSLVGWYSKLSYGYQLGSKWENTSIVLLELGLKLNVF